MTKHIDYKLLKHQKAFFNSTKPFSILLCGRGSGKTYCASLLAAVKLIQGERIMVFAQNFKSLSENLFSEILKRLDEIVPNQYTYSRQSMKLTFGKTRLSIWTVLREHRLSKTVSQTYRQSYLTN